MSRTLPARGIARIGGMIVIELAQKSLKWSGLEMCRMASLEEGRGNG